MFPSPYGAMCVKRERTRDSRNCPHVSVPLRGDVCQTGPNGEKPRALYIVSVPLRGDVCQTWLTADTPSSGSRPFPSPYGAMCVKRGVHFSPPSQEGQRFRPLTGRCVSNGRYTSPGEASWPMAFPSPYGAMCVKLSGPIPPCLFHTTGFPSPYGAMCVKLRGPNPRIDVLPNGVSVPLRGDVCQTKRREKHENESNPGFRPLTGRCVSNPGDLHCPERRAGQWRFRPLTGRCVSNSPCPTTF